MFDKRCVGVDRCSVSPYRHVYLTQNEDWDSAELPDEKFSMSDGVQKAKVEKVSASACRSQERQHCDISYMPKCTQQLFQKQMRLLLKTAETAQKYMEGLEVLLDYIIYSLAEGNNGMACSCRRVYICTAHQSHPECSAFKLPSEINSKQSHCSYRIESYHARSVVDLFHFFQFLGLHGGCSLGLSASLKTIEHLGEPQRSCVDGMELHPPPFIANFQHDVEDEKNDGLFSG